MTEIRVEKMSYLVLVPVDADGTPLEHGERCIEVEPGVWVSPLVAAATGLLGEPDAR